MVGGAAPLSPVGRADRSLTNSPVSVLWTWQSAVALTTPFLNRASERIPCSLLQGSSICVGFRASNFEFGSGLSGLGYACMTPRWIRLWAVSGAMLLLLGCSHFAAGLPSSTATQAGAGCLARRRQRCQNGCRFRPTGKRTVPRRGMGWRENRRPRRPRLPTPPPYRQPARTRSASSKRKTRSSRPAS